MKRVLSTAILWIQALNFKDNELSPSLSLARSSAQKMYLQFYQTEHFFSGFILDPRGQLKL